jgi:hypothetical protein
MVKNFRLLDNIGDGLISGQLLSWSDQHSGDEPETVVDQRVPDAVARDGDLLQHLGNDGGAVQLALSQSHAEDVLAAALDQLGNTALELLQGNEQTLSGDQGLVELNTQGITDLLLGQLSVSLGLVTALQQLLDVLDTRRGRLGGLGGSNGLVHEDGSQAGVLLGLASQSRVIDTSAVQVLDESAQDILVSDEHVLVALQRVLRVRHQVRDELDELDHADRAGVEGAQEGRIRVDVLQDLLDQVVHQSVVSDFTALVERHVAHQLAEGGIVQLASVDLVGGDVAGDVESLELQAEAVDREGAVHDLVVEVVGVDAGLAVKAGPFGLADATVTAECALSADALVEALHAGQGAVEDTLGQDEGHVVDVRSEVASQSPHVPQGAVHTGADHAGAPRVALDVAARVFWVDNVVVEVAAGVAWVEAQSSNVEWLFGVADLGQRANLVDLLGFIEIVKLDRSLFALGRQNQDSKN